MISASLLQLGTGGALFLTALGMLLRFFRQRESAAENARRESAHALDKVHIALSDLLARNAATEKVTTTIEQAQHRLEARLDRLDDRLGAVERAVAQKGGSRA